MTLTSRPLSVYNPLHAAASAGANRSWGTCARILGLALLPLMTACSESPTGPSPTGPSPSSPSSATTRVISVVGNLAFGDVPVGSQRTMSYTIANSGSAPLSVSGTTISGGLAAHTVFSWISGQIAPGGSQVVTVRFQPTAAGNFNGTIAVNADQTAGSNIVAISGSAAGASIDGTWSGQYVVERCDGTGSNQDYFCSAGRGAYPPGSSLPISVTLQQSGASVNGSITLGRVVGAVHGTISPTGTLILQGTASAGTLSLSLSSWNTSVGGGAMNGSFAYNASLQGIPGVAVIGSRLSGVSRR